MVVTTELPYGPKKPRGWRLKTFTITERGAERRETKKTVDWWTGGLYNFVLLLH